MNGLTIAIGLNSEYQFNSICGLMDIKINIR